MTTLHRKKISRSDAFKSIWKNFASRFLDVLSKEHHQNGKRQLVVFSFDHIAHHINLFGGYEHEELDLFFDWVSKNMDGIFEGIALDVGANIGNHSLYFSDFFDQVLCFEPNQLTFKVLELNTEGSSNVRVFNYGISNIETDATLNITPTNIGKSSISAIKGENTTQQPIKLYSLDSIISENQNITLIKIDVEGHELEVIDGAKETIKRCRPLVLFEQHKFDFEGGRSPVIELLKSQGYGKFATISETLSFSSVSPLLLRRILKLISRLIFGNKIEMRTQNKIKPGFYNFLIAFPE